MPLSRRHIPVAASLAVLLGGCLFGALTYENFASLAVARNLLVDNAFLAIAAAGATLVILMGGIDLSVGSVMALTSILIARLVEREHWHPLPAMGLALAVGAGFGAGQGLLIQAFRLPAFLVTLAGLFLARGAAFIIHPQSIGIRHPFIAATLNETLTLDVGERLALPVTVPCALAIIAAAWFAIRHTRPGRAVYAIGDDEAASLLMGLPVARVRIAVYAFSGLLSALAGVAFLLYQQSGDPAACRGFELDTIAAVVIGGTLLRGGIGSIPGTMIGVAILGLIQTLIIFQGNLSSWWTRIIIGALVLIFVAIQRGLGRLAGPAAG